MVVGLAAVGGFLCVYFLAVAQAPLGVRLPRVPRPMFVTQGVGPSDLSVVRRRVPEHMLEYLAPQPDGGPPMFSWFESARGGYRLALPLGADPAQPGAESFAKDGVDAISTFLYDMPLRKVILSLRPREQGEGFRAFAERLQKGLAGGTAHGRAETFDVRGYPFVALEFSYPAPNEETMAHCLFAGPYGRFVFVADFLSRPRDRRAARTMALKIVRTFVPGRSPEKLILPADQAEMAPSTAHGSGAKPENH